MNKCYQCRKEKTVEEFYRKNDIIYKICLECRASIYCEHDKEKRKCASCKGSQICKHNKNIYRCKICSENEGIRCVHNKEKYDCILCDGSGICEHKKRRRNCIDCDGSGICIHEKNRSICKICNGSQLCLHKIMRYRCKLCLGSGICEHNLFRKICPTCDPSNHLISLQRRRINYILSKNGSKKSKSTIEYLGCSEEFLYEHIKSQLTDDMEELGYEIDHIKPIAKFDFSVEGELEKCCHWSNLRPLLKKDNRIKSDKWSEEDEIEWNNLTHVCRQTTKT
jgi:hypothetical protein